MYDESITLTIENVMKIVYVAEKYDLEKLKMKCDEFLTENIDNCSNVLQTLEMSLQYPLPNLTEKALECIGWGPTEYLKSTEFTALSQQCVKTLFDYDKHCTEEINIYKAALKWAKEECARKSLPSSDTNMREVLGHILYSIRFPLMGSEFFCEEIVDTEILTLKEKVDVFKHFANKQSDSSPFINRLRMPKVCNVQRFDAYSDNIHCYNSPSVHAISFSVQKRAAIRGILVHSHNGRATYTATLQQANAILSTVQGHVYSEGDASITELNFSKTLKVEPGKTYSIVLNFTNGAVYGYSSGGGKSTVTFGENMVSFSHCQSSSHTTVGYGLIPGLLMW